MNEARFLDLLDALLDGRLSEAARAELEAELMSSEDARRLYWEYMFQHSSVAELLREEAGARRMRGARTGGLLVWSRVVAISAWLAAAAVLLLATHALLVRQASSPREMAGRTAPQIAASARVISVEGEVILTASDTGVRALQAGYELRSGDRIATSRAAAAVIQYLGEETVLELSARTEIGLSGGPAAKRVAIVRGRVAARIAPQPRENPMVFVTPHAQATVLGTSLTLTVSESSTRLEVAEGLVRLECKGESVDVASGRYALAGDGLVVGHLGRPFTPTSPWNARISGSPVLDPSSTEMVAKLGEKVGLALLRHAVPVYRADERTPVRNVICTMPWGNSPFEGHAVRVPDGARPNVGDNGALVVIDEVARRSWEFYKFSWAGPDVRCAWGGHIWLDGDGADSPHTGAAGGSWLGGLIRLEEVASGRIEHALAFASRYASRAVRYPAKRSDGTYGGPGGIPVGTRVRLDPSLDVAALPGITRGELAIARALQEYGAYCIGRTSELSMLFFAELAPDAGNGQVGAVYSASGLVEDEAGLEHLPWEALQVLARWDGR